MNFWSGCAPPVRSRGSPPSLVFQDDWRGLLMVLEGLVLDLVDRNDFVDLLDAGNDLGLVLVVLVNHGFVDFDNVEIVLVHIVLMDVVLVEVLLVDGVDVHIMLVEMVPEDDLLVLVVLVNLVLVVVKVLDPLLVGVVVVDFVDVLMGLDDLRLVPAPTPLVMVDDGFFPTPSWR